MKKSFSIFFVALWMTRTLKNTTPEQMYKRARVYMYPIYTCSIQPKGHKESLCNFVMFCNIDIERLSEQNCARRRIFHLCDIPPVLWWKETRTVVRGKRTAIRRLLGDLLIYDRRGKQRGLDLNSHAATALVWIARVIAPRWHGNHPFWMAINDLWH